MLRKGSKEFNCIDFGKWKDLWDQVRCLVKLASILQLMASYMVQDGRNVNFLSYVFPSDDICGKRTSPYNCMLMILNFRSNLQLDLQFETDERERERERENKKEKSLHKWLERDAEAVELLLQQTLRMGIYELPFLLLANNHIYFGMFTCNPPYPLIILATLTRAQKA